MANDKRPDPRPVPRLYLATPRLDDIAAFADDLAVALGAEDIAAVLLRFAEADERTLINRAKTLGGIAQAKDAAVLLEGNVELVARAGADGAHLAGIEEFNNSLETLKPDRIIGVGRLESRHDAMTAAEAGTDYVMFGEPDESGERPSFEAIEERVAWWAEVFEIPCVGYADNLDEISPLAAAGADFVILGDWLWRDRARIAATLAAAGERLRLPERTA
jgi:thiamine-phosphate pyrophosphorylase